MKSCIFCKNTPIYNILKDYANSSYPVKEDMIMFFGYQIEEHLQPDDAICNLCVNIIQNVSNLKRRLLPFIFRNSPGHMEEDCKPINLGKKWNLIASKIFDDDSDVFLESRSPTPSNLLTCKRVVPYEMPLEMKIAEIERHRSLSRTSVAKSEVDNEIVQAFSRTRTKRRKRGHNWTHRKNGRYSKISVDTRKSVQSTYTSRSYTRSGPISTISVMSAQSYQSFYTPAVEISSPVRASPAKSRVNGWLQNKGTTSIVKRQEEEIQYYYKDDALHQCPEQGCTFICEDIDLMAKHKTGRHRQLALFWCNFCHKKYTSSEDLQIHKRTHAKQYSCVICHKEFFLDTDLSQHWQEHVKKSVPCRYCGKRFIDKNICNKHQKNVHKRNVPSQIDFKKYTKPDNVGNKNFEVRILVQAADSLIED